MGLRPEKGSQQQPNEAYNQWANMGDEASNTEYIQGDTQEQYSRNIQAARQESARDIATRLGVNPVVMDNPQGMAIIRRQIGSIEYEKEGRGLIEEDGGKRRALNSEERFAATSHSKASRVLTPEEAKEEERRSVSLRGRSKHVAGLSVESDGSIRTSDYTFIPRDEFGTSWGFEQTVRSNPDGGLIVDRLDYSSHDDGFYETSSSRNEYNADGVLVRSEFAALNEDGTVEERVVTERDPSNPFVSKQIRYKGDNSEPEFEGYGIIDLSDANNISHIQRKEGVDPEISGISFRNLEHALVFDTRAEADSYYNQNLSGQEYSVQTVGFTRDDLLGDAVEDGISNLLSS